MTEPYYRLPYNDAFLDLMSCGSHETSNLLHEKSGLMFY